MYAQNIRNGVTAVLVRVLAHGFAGIDYMSLEEQVAADFDRARRRAFVRRLANRLQGESNPERLSCLGEDRWRLGAPGGVRREWMTVRVSGIAGSVGRCSEFDGAFLPASERARTRWTRVDRAFRSGEELPPVSLHKVGNAYFVEDGNHRVSVARYYGVGWIDAVVTEFRVRQPAALEGL